MKPAALVSMLLVLIASTVKAQLTLRPQLGFDGSKTFFEQSSGSSNNYAGISSVSPLGARGNLKADLRLDYRFPKGFGPYISVGTKPAPVEISFTGPSLARQNFTAAVSKLQWKLEAGYQYTSKQIRLGKPSTSVTQQKTSTHSSCGSHFGCGANQGPKKNNFAMRLQPSIGFAYDPSTSNDIASQSSGYTYKAGDWNTAIVPAMGFELDKGRQRILTLSVIYTKGLGNLGTQTITQDIAGKPYASDFKSSTSSWGMTVGIPFTLGKKHTVSHAYNGQRSNESHGCRSRCGGYSRCTRRI